MPLYAERAAADYLTGQEIVEQLGAWLAGQYAAAETELLAEIARRARLDMTTDDPMRRVRAIQALRDAAAAAVSSIDTEAAARRVVNTAMREGEAAAIEQLGFTDAARGATAEALAVDGTPLPFSTGITPGSATAAAQIGLELTSSLTDMNRRILRAVPDLYQQVVARFAGERLLGVTTGRQSRTRAVATFLAQGIPGFTDQAGRNWTIGAYTEMATRTATNRAWLGAHEQRWGAMGLHLVTIVRGSDSCARCAAWSGKILSTNGVTGTIQAEHATTGQPVTIEVVGTLASARAGGWNHPNCRCTLTPVFPGLSLPANDTTYDPQAEKNRERLRYLERRVRDFKRRAEIAAALGDDVAAAYYRGQVRAEQARIRALIAETGQVRKPYREALSYSGYAPARPTPAAIEA